MTQFEIVVLRFAACFACVLLVGIITSDRKWEAMMGWLGGLLKRNRSATPKPVSATADVAERTEEVHRLAIGAWLKRQFAGRKTPNRKARIRRRRKLRRQRVRLNRLALRARG